MCLSIFPDTLKQSMTYKAAVLPLEKGAGGIFPNGSSIGHANLTQ